MPLTNFEKTILKALPVGVENRVTIFSLCRKFRVNERDIKGVISELRKQQIPVGASRSKGGVYIARNPKELEGPIRILKSQAESMLATAKLLEDADFDWERSEII